MIVCRSRRVLMILLIGFLVALPAYALETKYQTDTYVVSPYVAEPYKVIAYDTIPYAEIFIRDAIQNGMLVPISQSNQNVVVPVEPKTEEKVKEPGLSK